MIKEFFKKLFKRSTRIEFAGEFTSNKTGRPAKNDLYNMVAFSDKDEAVKYVTKNGGNVYMTRSTTVDTDQLYFTLLSAPTSVARNSMRHWFIQAYKNRHGNIPASVERHISTVKVY